MAVHDGHRKRMLSKFLEHGIDTLHSHEMLEILLYYAIPRRDTNPIGHALIENFGSLRAVFDAPYEELLKVDGVGPSAATLIKMIPQMARAYYSDVGENYIIDSSQAAGKYLMPKYVGHTNEMVMVVCLDNKNKVIACVKAAEGVVNSTDFSKRRIAEIAMKYNAASIIISHNHPGGVALPSRDDIESTRRILRFLREMNIPLLDHIVVADKDYVSMAESHLLTDY